MCQPVIKHQSACAIVALICFVLNAICLVVLHIGLQARGMLMLPGPITVMYLYNSGPYEPQFLARSCRKRCERDGKYLEARAASVRLAELKTQEAQRMRQAIMERQACSQNFLIQSCSCMHVQYKSLQLH